jgi:hypothetical protein
MIAAWMPPPLGGGGKAARAKRGVCDSNIRVVSCRNGSGAANFRDYKHPVVAMSSRAIEDRRRSTFPLGGTASQAASWCSTARKVERGPTLHEQGQCLGCVPDCAGGCSARDKPPALAGGT